MMLPNSMNNRGLFHQKHSVDATPAALDVHTLASNDNTSGVLLSRVFQTPVCHGRARAWSWAQCKPHLWRSIEGGVKLRLCFSAGLETPPASTYSGHLVLYSSQTGLFQTKELVLKRRKQD